MAKAVAGHPPRRIAWAFLMRDLLQSVVLYRGRIVRSGGKELALELEKSGYAEFTGKAA